MPGCIKACFFGLFAATGIRGVVAYEDGAPPAHSGGFGENTCIACHFGNRINDPGGSLAVDGLPAAYVPGSRYGLTVTLRHAALESGGFQLSMRSVDGISVGDFEALSPRAERVAADGVVYLQHTTEGRHASEPGVIHWSFEWQAPRDAVPVVLHVAANAANDDLSALGDHIYTLEKHIETRSD